jgi:hypothetical protein
MVRPALIVVGVGLTAGLLTGVGLGRPDAGSAVAATGAGSAVVAILDDPLLDRDNPGAAAVALTGLRLDMLSGAQVDPDDIAVPGSAAHAADAALLERLHEAGVQPRDVTATVHDVAIVAAGQSAATVRLVYVIAEHDEVEADGTRVRVAASPERAATLDLTWTDDGWRVATVS